MRDRLMAETKAALKAGDKQRLSALRLISAALQERDIAAKAPIPEQDIPAVLQKMIKQRRESLAIYEQAGRAEQAKQEAAEIAVIEEFLPTQMSETEATARPEVSSVATEIGVITVPSGMWISSCRSQPLFWKSLMKTTSLRGSADRVRWLCAQRSAGA